MNGIDSGSDEQMMLAEMGREQLVDLFLTSRAHGSMLQLAHTKSADLTREGIRIEAKGRRKATQEERAAHSLHRHAPRRTCPLSRHRQQHEVIAIAAHVITRSLLPARNRREETLSEQQRAQAGRRDLHEFQRLHQMKRRMGRTEDRRNNSNRRGGSRGERSDNLMMMRVLRPLQLLVRNNNQIGGRGRRSRKRRRTRSDC